MANIASGVASRPPWLVPVLTFVVGLALGAGLLALLRPAPHGPGADQSGGTPVAVSPSGSGITVPASCTQGLERARAALDGAGEAVDALRRLQTARVQRILDDLQGAQADVDRLSEECRRQSRAVN
ncbi:hypothetical protein [Pseudosporangium ferrugineum]|uniref:Uncharacterized protein n=1 Tax=Pseudosporangium ferrugineum TaxID=439699 RepID=A0A2T0RG10_9ACTN|nr:hypothetical protein [Pseudosporangium ferrugineum]PRY20144.1 hypothetical protein CLV70_12525 [Pseudosporangium ferrugineum]